MAISDLFQPLSFKRGPQLKNRILLAPLTNQQSNLDGTASNYDLQWYEKCASGGYSLTMTCAANVEAIGKAFPGQLGIYDDKHLKGLTKIAQIIRNNGSLSSVQLHHGGIRGLQKGHLVGPSDYPFSQARGLSLEEVQALRDDFVTAAKRAEQAGFDGVEVHGAFGFIFAQFLSATHNHRKDEYGGSLENRSRLMFEVIDGIRNACKPDFQIGLRLSVERHGMVLEELRDVAAEAMYQGKIDFLEVAPWDVEKEAEVAPFKGQTLLSIFTNLNRGDVRLGTSGKVMTAQQAAQVLEAGCDFVMIGRGAILNTNFPKDVLANPNYISPALPVTETHLAKEGLSPAFINYMRQYDGFVK